MTSEEIINAVSNGIVAASTCLSSDKQSAFRRAIANESSPLSKEVLELLLENYSIAVKNNSPLCDDTGIPHLILEVGKNQTITSQFLADIQEGVRAGLEKLPGRPMAVRGDACERIEQSIGLSDHPSDVSPAPLLMTTSEDETIRLKILMHGGGPEIRAKTYRVFHKHDVRVVIDEIVRWALESVPALGCSPCTLAIGIGRSHYEASSYMLMAQAEGDYSIQSDMEKEITDRINASQTGPLGLGGNTSVLGTFIKVAPQRASGVRIVCMRPCCCFEPRKIIINLSS
jgi:fumarate hydratase subunit alpha